VPGSPRVVCIGIATVDAIVSVERLPGSDERVPGLDGRLAGGGVAATAAVALSRLGVQAAVIARAADDEAGRWIRDGLAAEGVDVAGFQVGRGRSAIGVVLIEAGSGLRALAPFIGDRSPIELTDADLAACAAADWIHLDDLGLATLPAIVAAGIRTPISVDDGVGVADVAIGAIELYAPTERVLQARFPAPGIAESLERAVAAGPRLVVASLGSAGSIAAERVADGRVVHHRAAALRVAVESTLGAGDVFHGALLAAIVDGHSTRDALVRANAAAALSCRALDGRSGIPTLAELEAFLAGSSPERPADSAT
jgi:sulfofructose kinase